MNEGSCRAFFLAPAGPTPAQVPVTSSSSLCPPDQLLRTSEDVAKMQEELEIMRPLLEEAAKDTMLTMEQIKVVAASVMSGHV